ncbi:MAG: hypothetical protein ABMB14_01885 [Myxococcota bacterium]
MIVALAWLGCGNQAPELLSLNGKPYDFFRTGEAQGYFVQDLEPGERFELEVQYRDPEGDPVEVRFVDMPGVVTFDPHGTTGYLDVFEFPLDTGDWPAQEGLIVLLDDHDPPAWREFPFAFWYRDDTGR